MPVPQLSSNGWLEVMRARAKPVRKHNTKPISFVAAVLLSDYSIELVAGMYGMVWDEGAMEVAR